jgi:hypothetical protein
MQVAVPGLISVEIPGNQPDRSVLRDPGTKDLERGECVMCNILVAHHDAPGTVKS